jgi:hypothetical protein
LDYYKALVDGEIAMSRTDIAESSTFCSHSFIYLGQNNEGLSFVLKDDKAIVRTFELFNDYRYSQPRSFASVLTDGQHQLAYFPRFSEIKMELANLKAQSKENVSNEIYIRVYQLLKELKDVFHKCLKWYQKILSPKAKYFTKGRKIDLRKKTRSVIRFMYRYTSDAKGYEDEYIVICGIRLQYSFSNLQSLWRNLKKKIFFNCYRKLLPIKVIT